MKILPLIKMFIVCGLLTGALALIAPNANALGFIQIQPMTFNLKALNLKGIFTLKFNRTLMVRSILTCPIIQAECELEYKRCAARLDYFDQAGHMSLLEAKNACIYSCDKSPAACFGLNISAPKNEITLPVPQPFQPKECIGPRTIACKMENGSAGTRTAVTCDTLTGRYEYTPCESFLAEIIVKPLPILEEPAACINYLYSNWGICSNGTQSRSLVSKFPLGCVGEAPGPFTRPCQLFNFCTSFTYGPWGTCQNGIQTRSVLTSSPSGCVGGNPLTSQSCGDIPPPPSTCTSFTYGTWGTCQDGIQKRSVLTSSPAGCTGGNPVTTQACGNVCTSFTYGTWGTCQDGIQKRSVLTSSPAGCTGGNPVTMQSCSITCTSFTYSGWSACVEGRQYRTVVQKFPAGCTGGSPVLSQSCITCNNFDYSAWSSTCVNGKQTRTVLGSYPKYCTGGNPVTSQSCTACTAYIYTDWSRCLTGWQTRTLMSKYPLGCVGEAPGPFGRSCTPIF